MLGLSYGDFFMIIGVTAALLGPKDLPIIARAAGRLAGRATGYVQLARGQFEKIMQQSEVHKVNKEYRDLTAQVVAIGQEFRSFSSINSAIARTSSTHVETEAKKPVLESMLTSISSSKADTHVPGAKIYRFPTSAPTDVHSQAIVYSKSAEATEVLNQLTDESGLTVLPVSAESAGLLPDKKDDIKGSDIVLEAVLESQVAHNAKVFFTVSESPKIVDKKVTGRF